MAIIGGRAAHFKACAPPEIELPSRVKLNKECKALQKALSKAIGDKYFPYNPPSYPEYEKYEKMYLETHKKQIEPIDTAIGHILDYLTTNGLLKRVPGIPARLGITLWPNRIELGIKYEGIRIGLHTALTKKLFPRVYDQMGKGAIMGYYPLDVLGYTVEYTLEFLKKQKVLEDISDKRWLELSTAKNDN